MSLLVILGIAVAALLLGLLSYQVLSSEPEAQGDSPASGPGRDVPGEPPDESPPV